jgi:hypothetical protein
MCCKWYNECGFSHKRNAQRVQPCQANPLGNYWSKHQQHGGGFVNVKVTPSGSLITALGDIDGVSGQETMANSLPVVIASDQSAVPISDDGGSITVDGTVAATQSGTWNINSISGTVSLPTGAATESTLSTLDGKVTACNTGAVTLASQANPFSALPISR